METTRYKNGLKPVLLRDFKQIFKLWGFSDEKLSRAIKDQKDPIELLEYLRDSVYLTTKEKAEIVRPLIANIREIASRTQYHTRHGSDVVSVTNDFVSLMKSMKTREMDNGAATVLDSHKTVVARTRKPQAEETSVKGNKKETHTNTTPATNSKPVTVESKAWEAARVASKSAVDYNKNVQLNRDTYQISAGKKGQKDGGGDWVILEESDIDDFVVVEVFSD